MHRLRRHLTYANVASLVAIVAVTCGTTYAAAKRPVQYTSAQVKDSSLTGLDFKNASVEAKDLSPTAISSMRGRKGATGAAGAKGSPGGDGPIGNTGDRGASAHSLVRYASFTSELVRSNADGVTANAGGADWDDETYQAYAGSDATYPNYTTNFSGPNKFPIDITENEPVLVQLTGNNDVTTGTIRPTSGGLLSATATLTILHSPHGETDHEGGLELHGRIRCTLRYANNGQSIGAGSPKLGASEWLSSRKRHKLYTITITGSEKITANAAANYNVGVSCVDVDRTGSNQWTFTAGNITAHAIYVES